jgi:hypothetical protein
MILPGQKDLFNDAPPAREPHYNGPEYKPERDFDRLAGQTKRVFNLMKDGKARTLEQIASLTGDPVASISAQLRHLRKERFGKHTIGRAHLGGGLYNYTLTVNPNAKNED